MKRVLVLAVLVCGAAAPTSATACDEGVFTVQSWQVEPKPGDYPVLTASLTYEGKSAVRMVDALIVVADALGGHITAIGIDRDLHAEPGATFNNDSLISVEAGERLLSLHPDDVAVTTCTRAIIYQDGLKQVFE